MTFRKNTVAALESPASAPDAILTLDEVSSENPVPGSSDQRTALSSEEGLEPIESTHARVALTFSDRPCVEGLMLAALVAEAEVGEKDATRTFTRGGTVTVTVCVRRLDPRWATAAGEIIALPTTIANSSERRDQTI